MSVHHWSCQRTWHQQKSAIPDSKGCSRPQARAVAQREGRGTATPAHGGPGTSRGATSAGTGFFQGSLAAHRGKSPEAGTEFRQAVYEQIRHVDGQQGELTIERMCILAAVSRAGYYRFLLPRTDTDEEESRLRDAIQRAAIGSRHYGY